MKNFTLFLSLVCTLVLLSGWNNTANAQWLAANSGLPINEVNSFATIGSTIFASTGNISGNGQGVFKSTDNGNSWTAVNTGLISLDTRKIIAVADTLFVAIAGTNLTDGGVYKSTDNGNTWVQTSNGLARKIAYSIVHMQGILYTAINAPASAKAVYTSSDYGNSWTITNSPVLDNNTIKSMVSIGGNLIAASDGGTSGVYRSTDGGATWSATSIMSGTDAVAVLGSTVFAATGIGVKKSADNGATWTNTTNTSGVIDNATALAVVGNCLMVATPGGRIFSTSDEGTTWNDVSTGGGMNLSAEALGMDATYLYAGVNFKAVGVWRRPLSEFACGITRAAEISESSSSVLVYPNPSKGTFTVSASKLFHDIKVYDILGHVVCAKIIRGETTEINLGDQPKGVYFYRLTGNDLAVKIGKIIIE